MRTRFLSFIGSSFLSRISQLFSPEVGLAREKFKISLLVWENVKKEGTLFCPRDCWPRVCGYNKWGWGRPQFTCVRMKSLMKWWDGNLNEYLTNSPLTNRRQTQRCDDSEIRGKLYNTRWISRCWHTRLPNWLSLRKGEESPSVWSFQKWAGYGEWNLSQLPVSNQSPRSWRASFQDRFYEVKLRGAAYIGARWTDSSVFHSTRVYHISTF